jgi:hypothetical protein
VNKYEYQIAYEVVTECLETLALKLQTPVNHPEESIQHSEQSESLKSRTYNAVCCMTSAALVPKFVDSNPAEAVGFFRQKNPQHAFLWKEVKPSVPCRSFAAC